MNQPTPSFVSQQVTNSRRFYLDLLPPEAEECTVVCGGWEHVAADYLVRREDFPYLCVEFVADGCGQLQLAGKKRNLSPGSVFVYGEGVPHEIRTSAEHPMTKYYVDFVGEQAAILLATHNLAPGNSCQIASPHELRELFDLIVRSGYANSRFSQQLCSSLIPTLVYKISESVVESGEETPIAAETFRQLRTVLHEQFLEVHNVEEAARICRISVAYACRLFRRFEHSSPYQFLIRRRMHHAAELLSEPQRLVKQVSRRLGFTDATQFSRAFKRVHGITPRRFQQLQSGRMS